MKNLVIVESPTKAKTLSKFLGKDYIIEASMGHIRDLPKAELGIDVEKNFTPRYIIPKDKQKRVGELKRLAHQSDTIYLASDPDREGEAIAWHLSEVVREKGKGGSQNLKRVVFHEITKPAIEEAFLHPREIDPKLVDAQQARRVLDRLVGYNLSPLLWRKVRRGLSAGRVQSVALRLIVEREREIQAFKAIEYWSIEALLGVRGKGEGESQFFANLIEWNGKKVEVSTKEEAESHVKALETATYNIEKVTKKQTKRTPPPPFITSTLQQAAGNKLGFTAKRTMSGAQGLYERGFITYMRTDSVNLSPIAVEEARKYILGSIGKSYLPNTPRVYKTKSKSAQEAHEAIRPTTMSNTPDLIKREDLSSDQKKLYEIIWKRMIASQMSEAVFDQTSVDVKATLSHPGGSVATDRILTSDSIARPMDSLQNDNVYTLRANGSVVLFEGWLKLYGVQQESSSFAKASEDKEDEEQDSKNQILPELEEGQKADLIELKPEQHFSEPPPRFNEASLIKKLEELGIGRPSTYAPTISTIQERYYVERVERRLIPTALGMAVNDFLIKNFPDILDYDFKASMEDKLDAIAEGEQKWQPVIGEFYSPFAKKVLATGEKAERVKIEAEKTDQKCPECGKDLVIKFGKFGKFLACSGFPECKYTAPLEEKAPVPCPKDGGEVILRKTKKGRPFWGCKNYPKCDFASWTKPVGKDKSN